MKQLGINDKKMISMLQEKIDEDEKAGLNSWGGKYKGKDKPPVKDLKYWEKW